MGFDEPLTIEANGIAVSCSETGDGEPVVMLHGGESDKNQYRVLVDHLGDGIRSISYDQRDCGSTLADDEPYTLRTLADDAVGLMDALGLQRAHVMGFSYGGILALQVGLYHPSRVQSLVVGAAPYSHAAIKSHLGNITEMSPEDHRSHMLNSWLTPQGQANPELVGALEAALSGTSARPGSRRVAATANYDMSGVASGIDVPTLLIYGDQDPLGRAEYGHRLHEELPNSELVLLEEARHAMVREFPEQIGALVRRWMFDHPVGR